MNKKFKFGLILFILFIFIGCATTSNLTDTGIRGLLAAKNEVAAMAENYETIYQSASLTAQFNWKNEIDPLFLQVEDIFVEWQQLIDLGQDTTPTYKKYLMLRNLILTNLVEIKKG